MDRHWLCDNHYIFHTHDNCYIAITYYDGGGARASLTIKIQEHTPLKIIELTKQQIKCLLLPMKFHM